MDCLRGRLAFWGGAKSENGSLTQCQFPTNSTIPAAFMCPGTQRSLVHECRQFTKGFPTSSRGQTLPIRLCRGLKCAADCARGSSCQAGSLGQTKAQPRKCRTRPAGVALQRREAPTLDWSGCPGLRLRPAQARSGY